MKVKRFKEFINEGSRPMSLKDIVDGPSDKENNFTEGEIKILEKLGFENKGNGDYHNQKRGIWATKSDRKGHQQYNVSFSHDNWGRGKSSFMGVLNELGEAKLATKEIIKQAGNKGLKNFDSNDMEFFKVLGMTPLGYFGQMTDKKLGTKISKTEDGRYYIHFNPNVTRQAWMTKPDGYNLGEFIYDLNPSMLKYYKDKVIAFLEKTKDKDIEEILIDKYLWRWEMDIKRSDKDGSKTDEWMKKLVLSSYGKEQLQLSIDAKNLK
jgi:hypothetical protein